MLYKKNLSKELSMDLFKNPTCEYRGTPFWAWNCKLEKGQIGRQIRYLKEMGFGGFHMHSRVGMDTEYLGEEFMDIVKFCADTAEEEDMLAWLYDEDRWPSGAAGGIVTKNPEYREKQLLFTCDEIENALPKEEGFKLGRPYLIACFDIVLNENGELASYKKIDPRSAAKGRKWFAYCKTSDKSGWYNNQTYVDTLDKKSIDEFIKVTYEAYKSAVGNQFGKRVPAIFTDEPQFARKRTLSFADSSQNVTLPWTTDLEDSFKSTYGLDVVEGLPELFWELPEGKISKIRYLYHDHVSERFTEAFADNCGKWCEENDILFTGHMMEEPTLESQTAALGEAMRSYRAFQLPGIDMLCDRVELSTAKQAQSAAHQYEREGVLSELYGVTNWDFDFRGHKFQGDWQAAMGVTVRVPHLSWVSMKGEAKRDYPASINYQAPWYKEYSSIENHFARLNTVLTRGKPAVKVGVIHPVESYWLHWGPRENTQGIREQLDENFNNVINWLLFGLVDFDFISESLLPSQFGGASGGLNVGKMSYSTIIVPGCETMRRTTFNILKSFAGQGGKVIFIGDCPKYIDAEPSGEIEELYNICKKAQFNRVSLLNCVSDEKELDIRGFDGVEANNLIYNRRRDSDCEWLFITRGKHTGCKEIARAQGMIIKIKGVFTPELFDTLNGETAAVPFKIENGKTVIQHSLHLHDSLLLKLIPGEIHNEKNVPFTSVKSSFSLFDMVEYEREEPNVLLLDRAEYSFNGEAFAGEEEIIRINELGRRKFGYLQTMRDMAQPWTIEEVEIKDRLAMRFVVASETDIDAAFLAIENAENAEIKLNGETVKAKPCGYYVDESIGKIALPPIKKGMNELVATIPFGEREGCEWCYIIGNFNVRVEGCVKTIVPPTQKIGFSSITSQGLPFYGGNITYKTKIETPDCRLRVKANYYRGAMVKVYLDGKEKGNIIFAPYKLDLGKVSAGEHVVEFKLFGNRNNTFGAIHNINSDERWYGPGAWHSTGDAWCYEYVLKDTGILASPVFEMVE